MHEVGGSSLQMIKTQQHAACLVHLSGRIRVKLFPHLDAVLPLTGGVGTVVLVLLLVMAAQTNQTKELNAPEFDPDGLNLHTYRPSLRDVQYVD